ncbi:helix-turn-helix transcriptional regulator [Virgibacillus halophilus]|uniref:AraC family transcriptional regulator n=1 Tax=Tigheibacillus halophilus TaxID=361280 RepID=A0ABU5C5T4_9BACI|nr:AraC family transcriptional regulator [Virgibacillus halophilus]
MDKNEMNYIERMEGDERYILSLDYANVIQTYDEKIFVSLVTKDEIGAEAYLSEVCFFLAELPEKDQIFILHIFFVSIVTDMTKLHQRNGRLHPSHITSSYALISTIDRWQTTTDYFSAISWFIHKVSTTLVPGVHFLEQQPHIEKIMDLIHAHLTDKKLSVAWLAEQLQFSTTHLASIFKGVMGESISHYIQRQKTEKITFELRFSSKPLKEICQSYGYSNVSNFIRTFKKQMGTTPLKYRQSYMLAVRNKKI